MVGEVQFDRNKFRDVIHFVIASCSHEELGRVKLHKILYFADMHNFLAFGRPLTGEDYIKQKFGPTARHLQAALRELEQQNRIRISERDFFGYPKQDFTALAEPNRARISDDEAKLLGVVTDFVCARTAKEISEISHNDAWQLADVGEVIPYFTAFSFVPSEITDEDRAWAEREAESALAAAN